MSIHVNFVSYLLTLEELTADDMLAFFSENPLSLLDKDSRGDLPIHTECANQARYDLICDMIEMYPRSLEIPGYRGHLPMHRAMFRSSASEEVVLMLIDEYPDAVKQRDDLGCLPIFAGCLFEARSNVLPKLIEVCPESLDIPCVLGVEYPPLETAIIHKGVSFEAIRLLITSNPKSLRRRDERGRLPIHLEAEKLCRWDVIKLCLELYPESGRIADYTGSTPLHIAQHNDSDSAVEVILNLIERYPEVLRMRTGEDSNPIEIECMKYRRLNVIKKCVEFFPESLAMTGNEHILPYEYLVCTCYLVDDFEKKKDVLAYVLSQYPAAFRLPDNDIFNDEKRFSRINRFLLNLMPNRSPSSYLLDYHDNNWTPRAPMINALLHLRSKVSSCKEANDNEKAHDCGLKSGCGLLAAIPAFGAKLFGQFDLAASATWLLPLCESISTEQLDRPRIRMGLCNFFLFMTALCKMKSTL